MMLLKNLSMITDKLMKPIINKKPAINWLFLMILLSLASCNADDKTQQFSSSTRIITLSPHLAELVASAGAIDNLVGVVAYSDFPEQIKNIQQVGDAFKLDYETLISLKPDYILSWKGGTPIAMKEKLKSLNLKVIETEINVLEDIPKTIAQIAKLTDTTKFAKTSITHFKNTLNKFKSNRYKQQSVFIETFNQPLYTVSSKHWISEASSICGFINIFNEINQLSTTVTLESVINKNPQALLNIAKQEDEQWQKWPALNAVKNNNIITISPDYFSRPSMRLLQGIENLCSYSVEL